MGFAQKVLDERNVSYVEKDRTKEKYDQACDAVEAAKVKLDKAPDEKSQERV